MLRRLRGVGLGWGAAMLVSCAAVGGSVALAQRAVTGAMPWGGTRPVADRGGAVDRGAVTPGAAVAQAVAADRAHARPTHGAPRVVIDPGHGGSNTGAASLVHGVFEKHITLALAKRVAATLEARGIEAVMTRSNDRYLSLRQRTDLANRAGADLFLSLHANATEDHHRRGFETFLLTPEALEVDARALRTESGRPRAGHTDLNPYLLDDIERGLSHRGAARLAHRVQQELDEHRPTSDNRGVRQAAMDVLYGATMPAVLVEVGFIDHPIEGKELLDPQVLDQLATALADAISAQLGVRHDGKRPTS